MPIYKLPNGKTYNIPEEKVNSFLQKYPDAVLQTLGKTTPPQEDQTSAFAGEAEALDMGLSLGMPSLGLPKQKKEPSLSAKQSLLNAASNLTLDIKRIGEFWTGESVSLDIASASIAQAVFGKNAVDEYVKKYGEESFLAEGLGSNELLERVSEFRKDQEKRKETLGVIESFKKGEIANGLAAAVGAGINALGSIIYGGATLGSGYFMDFLAENYVNYNEGKAKRLNVNIDELIKNDTADIGAPVAIAALQSGLEMFAFGKMTGALGKSVNSFISSKAGATAADVFATANTEALTELLQFGATESNKVLGETGSKEAAAKAYLSSMATQEGLESAVQGFLGGGGIKGSRYALNAAKNLRAPIDQEAIEKDIEEYANLNQQLENAKDKLVKEGIQKSIEEIKNRLNGRIINSNSIIPNFSNKEIDEITSMEDLSKLQIARVKELKAKLDAGEISAKEHNTALEGYKKTYINAKNKIQDIKTNVEDRSNKEAQKVNKLYEEKGKEGIAEILELYRPMAKRIASKYKSVPGFDFDLITDEILTGERGILDLINSYNPETNVPLSAYVNKYAATRGIEAAQRNLKQQFEADVTEAKGITDTVTAETEIQAKQEAQQEIKRALAKDLNLDESVQDEIVTAVEKTLGTKLPAVTDKAFKSELTKGFRTELTNTLKRVFGRQESYEQFLRDNFEKIYPAIPQETINKRFKEFNEAVVDPKTGKRLRERTAEGKYVFKKKDITKAEFLKYFLDAKGSTKGVRKTALAEVIANEVGLDNVLTSLAKPEVVEKFKAIQELQGQEVPSNFRAIIAKAINRIDDLISALDEFEKDKSILKSDFGLTIPAIKVLKLFLKGVKSGLKAGLTIEKAISNALKTFDKDSKKEELDPQEQKVLKEAIKNIPAEDYISKQAEDIINRIDKEYNKLFKIEQSKSIDEVLIPLYKDKAKGKSKAERIELAKDFWSLYRRTFQNVKGTKMKEMYSIINTIFGDDFKFTNKSVDGKKFKANLIDQTKTSKFAEKYKNNKEKTIADQHKQADKNFDRYISLLNDLKEKYNNKEITIDSVYFLLKATGADMNSVGKKIQRLGENVDIEALNKNAKMTLEHNSPFDFTLKNILLPYILNDIKSSNELVSILKLQKLELIDAKKAFELNYKDGFNLKTTMPDGYKITDDPIVRLLKVYPDLQKQKSQKSLNQQFNEDILQKSTGVDWAENYSPATAKMLARGKGKGNLFIPYSAEDFVGLLYTTLAKREVGDQQMEWYNENLIRPFSRGIQAYEAEKQRAMREWSVLKQRAAKDVPGGLKKQNESGFTNEESLRMYIWQRQGMEIPNIQKGEVNNAIKAVRNNEKFKAFANTLMSLNPEGYPAPSDNWIDGDITSDLIGYVNGAKRAEFLTQWKENVDQIFSEKNKTKLRALYGDRYVEALEDMLFRMEKGTNRSRGTNKQTRAWMDWVNNSVGTIMFFNARSAVLQTLSTVNFINFSDNNPINAALALANFGQYRQDFVDLFNSDFLKQRRSGLQIDVNADEIAKATKGNEKSPRAILRALLQFGFTPTQIADSFAIAAGGATFYRNRINKYIKEGLSEAEAKKRAFTDFQEIAEETQQSARPDRISMEQASSLGRVILAFANTPMQYARLQKKAFLDLINGRGDWKTNTSKIMYYGVIQNVIFSALQQALFALLFDDEDEAEEKNRYYRIGNASLDTFLRGVGVAGAGVATVKNIILEIIDQAKSKRPDYTQAAIAATSVSPPINSKLRKLLSAGRAFTYKQSREKIFTEGFSLENPVFLAAGQVLSAGANIPADRIVIKADHLYTAMQPETELWQAIALSLGWSEWDLGMIEKQTKKSKPFNPRDVKRNINRGVKRKKIKR